MSDLEANMVRNQLDHIPDGLCILYAIIDEPLQNKNWL